MELKIITARKNGDITPRINEWGKRVYVIPMILVDENGGEHRHNRNYKLMRDAKTFAAKLPMEKVIGVFIDEGMIISNFTSNF